MSHVDFKALIKKINLKPKGVKEIVLEVSDSALKGHLDRLAEMIDEKAEIQIESLVVNYNVTLNANTNRPITEYRVDNNGIVSEVKTEVEQLEADLDLPEEKVPTKEEKKEIDREQIDEFIISGLAPQLEQFPENFAEIVKRKVEGESFTKLATELEMSSGKVADLIDAYRKEVAPLAEAWWNWKEENGVSNSEDKEESVISEGVNEDDNKSEQENNETVHETGESVSESNDSESEEENTDGAA